MQRNTFPAAAIECRQAVGTNQLVDFGPTDVQGAGYLGNGEQENRESLLNRLLDGVGFFWHCSSLLKRKQVIRDVSCLKRCLQVQVVKACFFWHCSSLLKRKQVIR